MYLQIPTRDLTVDFIFGNVLTDHEPVSQTNIFQLTLIVFSIQDLYNSLHF
jgi:hypothetical protein